MKGFSVSRGLRAVADAVEKQNFGIGYHSYRWQKLRALVCSEIFSRDLYVDRATGKLCDELAENATPISYTQWKHNNRNQTYEHTTLGLTLIGCCIGLAFSIHESAKSRAERSYYARDNTEVTIYGIGGAVFGGLAGYLWHITLPLVFVHAGVLQSCNLLTRLYGATKRHN